MKKNYFTLVLVLFVGTLFAQDLTYVPDDNFENYLEGRGAGDGIPNNNYVNSNSISYIVVLDLRGINNILDLTGIKSFVNLNALLIGSTPKTSYDISGLSRLTHVECKSSSLTSLNVNGLTSLKYLILNNNSYLTNIDVRGLTSLISLDCYDNSSLTSLDVSGLISLKSLNCVNTSITSLNVSGATSLVYLRCDYNSLLPNLDVSGATSLDFLRCDNNASLTSLVVSGLNSITYLYCGNNSSLPSLDASGLTSLTDLECFSNSALTGLTVSGLTSLTNLICNNNALTSLDVSGLTSMTSMNCSFNSLNSLDVRGLTSLTQLNCYNNALTSLDVSGLTSLTTLNCPFNSLTSLDVRGLTSLTYLTCYNNVLTSLDVSGLTSLTTLLVHNNKLTSLDVSKKPSLNYLNCSNNNLCFLNIKNGNNDFFYVNSIGDSFNATGNPNLICIQVDDIERTFNFVQIDPIVNFSDNCINKKLKVFNINSSNQESELEIEHLSISADGSSATLFKYIGGDFENVKFIIKEELISNPAFYGIFQTGKTVSNTLEINYSHPTYFSSPTPDFPNPQNKEITVQVLNKVTNNVCLEFPVKIVRPSLLMVHGIWSSGRKSFGEMEEAFITDGSYKKYQIHKVDYNGEIFNKLNLPVFKAQKNELKQKAIENNISLGKVDIVAHSNGGLLTRHYIQSEDYLKDVNKFITLNTPHSGSQLANLLLSSGKGGLALNFFLDKTSPVLGKNPNSGIISDLRVKEIDSEESFYITTLNNPDVQNMQNYDHIAIHSLTSTWHYSNENLGWDVLIAKFLIFDRLVPYVPSDALGITFNKITESILQSPNHDVIVALASQWGGSDSTTNTNNLTHVHSTGNDEFINNVKTLLNSNPDGDFSFTGFSPTVLNTNFVSTGTTGKKTKNNLDSKLLQIKSNETISIVSPAQGTEYSAGGIVETEIIGSSGIVNILAISGSPNSTLQSIPLENTNTGSVQFAIPEDFLGKYNIICAGFDINGYANYHSSYINVTTNAILESITIDQERIFIVEGNQNNVTILGYFNDGITRDITNSVNIDYNFLNQKAESNENGIIRGLEEGEDILTVVYAGKSTSVPITVLKSITLSTEETINGINNIDGFVIFPNPTKNKLTIKFPINQLNANVRVLDLLGKEIFSKDISNTKNELDISSLQIGMYLVKIKTESYTVTKRVIKQ